MLAYSNVSDLENCRHLCGGPLVNGECEAYNWNDQTHLSNRASLNGAPSEEKGE